MFIINKKYVTENNDFFLLEGYNGYYEARGMYFKFLIHSLSFKLNLNFTSYLIILSLQMLYLMYVFL